MTDTTTQIPARAIEDMRDVLDRDFGFVTATTAPEASVLRKIALKYGSVDNFLDFYGPY